MSELEQDTNRAGSDAWVREALGATSPPLSDLERARIGNRVLADVEVTASQRSGGGRWRTAPYLAAGAVACVVIGWWLGRLSEQRLLALEVAHDLALEVAAPSIAESPAEAATPEAPSPSRAPAPKVSRVFTAQPGERVAVSIGRAELTLFGPGRIEIDEADPHTVRVDGGTVVGAANGEPIALVDSAATQRLSGAVIGIRVEGSVVVASASSEAAVRRVFRLELRDHQSTHAAPAPTASLKDASAAQREGPDTERAALSAERSATLYAEAESAMKRGDLAAAGELLERLVTEHPESRDASLARYDLALLALRAGDHGKARARLDAILSDPELSAQHAAARRLRCRVLAAEAGTDPSGC